MLVTKKLSNEKTRNDTIIPAKGISTFTIYGENKILKNRTFIKNGFIEKNKLEQLYNDHNTSNDHIFFSYGNIKGNFYFKNNDNILENILDNDYYFKEYALVEKKTEYYKLMFDFDFKNKNGECDKYIDNSIKIVDFIINHINTTLEQSFIKPNIKYIYCDKNEGSGIHLYYPEIIVNKFIHSEIYKSTFAKIIKNDIFDLSELEWSQIFDDCITNANGLRLPYFYIKGTFYKQNKSKSTYKISEYDGAPDLNILQLCCIRTNKTEIYPKTAIVTHEKINDSNQSRKIVKKNVIKQMTHDKSGNINKISIDVLDKLLECVNIDKFLKYESWFALKFMVFNCNNSIDACKIFHKYCCIGKYKNIQYDEIENAFMKTTEHSLFDATVLRCYARNDNLTLFNSYKLGTVYDTQTFNTIKISLPKMTKLQDDENDTVMEISMKKFLNDKNKHIFCIHSGYGTGKTTYIKDFTLNFENVRNLLIFNFINNLPDTIIDGLECSLYKNEIIDIKINVLNIDIKMLLHIEVFITSYNDKIKSVKDNFIKYRDNIAREILLTYDEEPNYGNLLNSKIKYPTYNLSILEYTYMDSNMYIKYNFVKEKLNNIFTKLYDFEYVKLVLFLDNYDYHNKDEIKNKLSKYYELILSDKIDDNIKKILKNDYINILFDIIIINL